MIGTPFTVLNVTTARLSKANISASYYCYNDRIRSGQHKATLWCVSVCLFVPLQRVAHADSPGAASPRPAYVSSHQCTL